MRKPTRTGPVAALCVALASLAAAAPAAQGAEPLYEFFASATREGQAHAPYPPPGSGFEGPCGIAVDSRGNFYVSDYYHHNIDVFQPSRGFLTQLAKVDPVDGPCGLALDASGVLYVNNYHRNVVRYVPAEYPLGPGAAYGPATVIDSANPTGVAVDPVTARVYVNNRRYVSVYNSTGAPVLDGGGDPLRIGEGTLEDGYGLAVSQHAPTAGWVYVADAGSDVVRAYDPTIDTVEPVQVIDGQEVPGDSFVSLRDSALAVDRLSGQVYVADLLQPLGYERPEAAIYAFEAGGAYAGRLQYNVIDAMPPGLAVDNSPFATAGRVYVTTGNSEGASVYAYAPGSATNSAGTCAPGGPCPTPPPAAPSASVVAASSPPPPPAPAPAAVAVAGGMAEGQIAAVPSVRRPMRQSARHRHRHRGKRERDKRRPDRWSSR